MKAKDQNGDGKQGVNGREDEAKPTEGPDEPLAKKKAENGHHPRSIAHRFPAGVSGNPVGRPPGIPNLNDLLISAVKRFKGGIGPKGKRGRKKFFAALLEKAFYEDPDLLKQLLDKFLADATPAAGGQVNIGSQVTNEHSLHQTILSDPRVREAALALEERIAGSLGHSGGDGPSL